MDQSIVDGSFVAVGVAALSKGRDITQANFKAHGKYLTFDSETLKTALAKNMKLTVTASIVAGLAFAGVSWMSRVATSQQAAQSETASRGR